MKDAVRGWLGRVRRWGAGLASLGDVPRLNEQTRYLQRELERLRAANRLLLWQSPAANRVDTAQTRASFDFQWEHMPSGKALPTDPAFMAGLAEEIPRMVQQPTGWFAGRTVVDIGCGMGRYTYGFLQLGAHVIACDQSPSALRRTAELCAPFAERLMLKQIDLLEWDEPMDADLAFSFGVVHHTGNTYRAIEQVTRKVKPGGRVFLMIYSVPLDLFAFRDVNAYETIAEENHDRSFEERREDMVRRFGPERAHGWFDATSPRINDRLTFEEIRELLQLLGFVNITRRVVARDLFVLADRAASAPADARPSRVIR